MSVTQTRGILLSFDHQRALRYKDTETSYYQGLTDSGFGFRIVTKTSGSGTGSEKILRAESLIRVSLPDWEKLLLRRYDITSRQWESESATEIPHTTGRNMPLFQWMTKWFSVAGLIELVIFCHISHPLLHNIAVDIKYLLPATQSWMGWVPEKKIGSGRVAKLTLWFW